MLKKLSIRKIAVTTSALFILGMLYFFPTKTDTINLKQNITYENASKNTKVFLVDKNDYVSLVNVETKSKKTEDKIKESLELLIINSKKEKYLPKSFKAIIPKGTKVLSININNKLATLNFSKEILNIKNKNKEKMFEAIVYTLTEFKEIEKVKILVGGNPINNKEEVVDRTMGINKEFDIDSLSDISYTTVYYINTTDGQKYYTPVTKVTNDKREKIAVIIDELKSSLAYQSNLSSFLSSSAELQDYEIKESVMHLSFNEKIFDDFNSKNILEEVKYTISMSIKDNYNVEEVVFYVNDKEITKTALKTLEN